MVIIMHEHEHLEKLRMLAEDAVGFLDNSHKWEAECWICSRFLNGLGLTGHNILEKSLSEPPDVVFKEANFEIFLLIDKGRPLHKEWKKRLERIAAAGSLADIGESYSPPSIITAEEWQQLMMPTLNKKYINYTKRNLAINQIDILIYDNLQKVHVDLTVPMCPRQEIIGQGWRSVSVLGSSYCIVLHATEGTPDFISENLSKIKKLSSSNANEYLYPPVWAQTQSA